MTISASEKHPTAPNLICESVTQSVVFETNQDIKGLTKTVSQIGNMVSVRHSPESGLFSSQNRGFRMHKVRTLSVAFLDGSCYAGVQSHKTHSAQVRVHTT